MKKLRRILKLVERTVRAVADWLEEFGPEMEEERKQREKEDDIPYAEVVNEKDSSNGL